jgi:ATP adenylyltransferase
VLSIIGYRTRHVNQKQPSDLLEPGTLRALTIERERQALARGALEPIATDTVIVEADGVRFQVRILSKLHRKEAAARRAAENSQADGRPFNPFLPPDPDLTVAGVSSSHLCVLNKFNVIDQHLLIITRLYEAQDTLLQPADFDALTLCLNEIGGLGFYNGGRMAGASQAHKHLQLVPLPLMRGEPPMPIAPLLPDIGPDTLTTIPDLPIAHAFIRFEQTGGASPPAPQLHRGYLMLLKRLALRTPAGGNRPAPYNLLITRDWMLAVRRSAEAWEGISVNSLGFAGALLVRDQAGLDRLREVGPMRILQAVARPCG